MEKIKQGEGKACLSHENLTHRIQVIRGKPSAPSPTLPPQNLAAKLHHLQSVVLKKKKRKILRRRKQFFFKKNISQLTEFKKTSPVHRRSRSP